MSRANSVIRLSLSTAALVTLTALAAPARLRAQPGPIALEWNVPSGCPSAGEVLQRVRKLARVWPPTGAPLRAEATITRANQEELHLRLIVHAGELVGERNIAASACANLASATAIHIALLLNQSTPLRERDLSSPDASASADAPGETTASNAPASDAASKATDPPSNPDEPDSELEPGREPSAADSSNRSWRVFVQVPLASLQLGPLPRPSFGVSIAAGARIADWRFLADGRFWFQQRMELESDPRFGAEVDRIDAGLRVCRAMVWNPFELAPCLRISLQHIWARGTGAHVASQTAEGTWAAFGVGAQARLYLLEWFSLVGAVDAQLEASRPRVFIDGVGSLGKLGPAAVGFTLGSEWIF